MYAIDVTLEQFLTGEWLPREYEVFCYVEPTKQNKCSRPLLIRIGAARTADGCRELIEKDKKGMNETFGGLFDATGTSGRHYRVFRAEWRAVKDKAGKPVTVDQLFSGNWLK